MKFLFKEINKTDKEIPFSAFDLMELAGIARFSLNTSESQGRHSYLVTAQYQDAEDHLGKIGFRTTENRRIVDYLIDLVGRISDIDNRETPLVDWVNDPYKMMLFAREQGRDWFNLTKEQGFLLGLAAYIVAGNPDERHNWYDRETTFRTPLELLTARGFSSETYTQLAEQWSEIRQPSLEIMPPLGQLK